MLVREARGKAALQVGIAGGLSATIVQMPTLHVFLLHLEVQVVAGEVDLSEEHVDFAWVALADLLQHFLADQVRECKLDYTK